MTEQTNCINLRGAAKAVTQYLHYGINSILFQRGIYPPEEFNFKDEYGITFLVSNNKKVQLFLNRVLGMVEEWLLEQRIECITMVLFDVQSRKALERWNFKISYEDDHHMDGSSLVSNKSLEQIQNEKRNVLRQITSSISFLPLIEKRATFDIFIQPKKCELKNDAPSQWEWKSSLDLNIKNGQTVNLRAFSTGFDKVNTEVVYRLNED